MKNSTSSNSNYDSNQSDGFVQTNETAIAKFDFNAQKVYIFFLF